MIGMEFVIKPKLQIGLLLFSLILVSTAIIPNAFAGHTFPTINTVGPTVGVKAATFELGDPGGIFVDCTFTSAGAATISIFRDSPRVQLDVVGIATVGAGSQTTTFVITDTAIFTVDTYLIGCAFQETGADHNDSVSHRFNIVVPPVTQVEIDIKPGSDPNSINPQSRGIIPVAILSGGSFDATTVDVATLEFGPAGATPLHPNALHLEDVNDDGLTDLVSHYRTQQTGIATGQTEACITGETLSGIPIQGCDDIITNPV